MIPKGSLIHVIVFIQSAFAVCNEHNVKRIGVGTVVEWAECRGFEFESEEG